MILEDWGHDQQKGFSQQIKPLPKKRFMKTKHSWWKDLAVQVNPASEKSPPTARQLKAFTAHCSPSRKDVEKGSIGQKTHPNTSKRCRGSLFGRGVSLNDMGVSRPDRVIYSHQVDGNNIYIVGPLGEVTNMGAGGLESFGVNE